MKEQNKSPTFERYTCESCKKNKSVGIIKSKYICKDCRTEVLGSSYGRPKGCGRISK